MTRGFTRCAFVVYSEKTTQTMCGFRPVSHAEFFMPSRHSHAYGQDERGIYLNNLRRHIAVVESCPPSHWRATTKQCGGFMPKFSWFTTPGEKKIHSSNIDDILNITAGIKTVLDLSIQDTGFDDDEMILNRSQHGNLELLAMSSLSLLFIHLDSIVSRINEEDQK